MSDSQQLSNEITAEDRAWALEHFKQLRPSFLELDAAGVKSMVVGMIDLSDRELLQYQPDQDRDCSYRQEARNADADPRSYTLRAKAKALEEILTNFNYQVHLEIENFISVTVERPGYSVGRMIQGKDQDAYWRHRAGRCGPLTLTFLIVIATW